MHLLPIYLSLFLSSCLGAPDGKAHSLTDQVDCPINEYLSQCPLALCRPSTCKHKGKLVPCAAIASPCPSGCVCKPGYLKADNGTCIPEDTCPCAHNEVEDCIRPDCPKTCKDVDRECLDLYNISQCKKGCVCKEGYFTNTAGYCVSKENCLKY